MKNSIKRILSLLMVLTMVFTMAMPVCADDENTPEPQCTCTPVDGVHDTSCDCYVAPQPEAQTEPDPICTKNESCTLTEGHEGECVPAVQNTCTKDDNCTLTEGHDAACIKLCSKQSDCGAQSHYADCLKAIADAEAAAAEAEAKAAAVKAVQDMIDALPEVPLGYDPAATPADIAAQLEAITEAYKALPEDGQALVDATAYYAFYAPGPAVVAKIGDTPYASLEAAVEAANTNGGTITLEQDVAIASPIKFITSVTFEGNAHKISYAGTDRAITVENTANGANLTVKNLTVDAPNAERGINYNTTGKLTLNNVTVTAGTYAVNLPGSSIEAQVSIEGCTLSAKLAVNIWGKDSVINIKDSVLSSTGSTYDDAYAVIQLNNNLETAAEGTVVTVEGGSISNSADDVLAKLVTSNWTSTGIINISDETQVNGRHQTVLAIDEDGAGYETLQEACDELSATDGTVYLVRDIKLDEPVSVSGNVTLSTGIFNISRGENAPANVDLFSVSSGKTLKVTGCTEEELKALVPNVGTSDGEGSLNITAPKPFTVTNDVGTTGFDSIEDAIAEANENGGTVTMFANAAISTPVSISSSLTIDGNGHTISYAGTDRAITVENTANGANLTVKNLTVDAPNAQRGINYNTSGKLTLEKVTVTAGNYAVNLPGSSDNADVSIDGCTLNGLNTLNIWGENLEISVKNSILNTNDNTDAEDYAPITINNDGSTAANNCSIVLNNTTINYFVNGVIDRSKCAILSNVVDKNIDDIVNATNCTFNGTVTESVAIGPVYSDGSVYTMSSLQEAFDHSAQTGETVKLLRSVTVNTELLLSDDVTLDTNGKTLSFANGADIKFAQGAESAVLTIEGMNDKLADVKAAFPNLCVYSGSIKICGSHTAPTGSTCVATVTCAKCGGSMANPSPISHVYSYSASGNVITESCSSGCGHKAYATLSLKDSKKTEYPYTGSQIKPLTISYSVANNNGISAWAGTGEYKPTDDDIVYSNNVDPGTASGSITIGGVTASTSFKITLAELDSWEHSDYYRDSNKTLSFTIETDGKYAPGYVAEVKIYNSSGTSILHTLYRGSFTAKLDKNNDVVITIPASTMSKLGVGRYIMTALLESQPTDSTSTKLITTATTSEEFRVRYPRAIPSTGDSANFLLWGGLLLGATAAMGGTIFLLKKKEGK